MDGLLNSGLRNFYEKIVEIKKIFSKRDIRADTGSSKHFFIAYKQAQKARASFNEIEKHLSDFFNSYKEIGVLIDRNQQVLLYNKTAADFVQSFFNKEAKKGALFVDYCSADLRSFFSDCILKALSGEEVKNKEIEKKYPDGTVICWNVTFLPTFDDHGNIYAVAFMGEDISKYKIQMQTISNQNNSLKSIAWKQSHLTRSPLANLKALTTLVKEFPSDKKLLECMQHELEKLDTIICEIVKEASDLHL